MGRTRFLMGILLVAVMVAWIVTFFFYGRLPPKIPAYFDFDGSAELSDNSTFLIYPAVGSGAALLILVLYPLRRLLNFIGKGRVKDLPKEFSEPAYQRAYQIAVMAVIFVIMVLTFVQSNVALIATGQANTFNLMPIWGAVAIFAVYLIYSCYTLWRMTGAIEVHYHEWRESGEKKE